MRGPGLGPPPLTTAAPRVEARAYRLALARPLATAARRDAVRAGWLVRIAAADGALGHGEASPLPGHGPEDPAAVAPALAALVGALTHAWPDSMTPPPSPGEWRPRALRAAPNSPAARAAFDLALADLSAQRAEVPMARWLAAAAAASVPVNGLIGAVDSDAEAAEEARCLAAAGFGTLKVKLGGDAAAGIQRLEAVRAAVGGGVALRADANGAWDEGAAMAFLGGVRSLDLEYVEQPVAPENVAALARLRGAWGVALAADEALLVPGGARRVLEMRAADVLVLKPSLLGGPTEALALSRRGLEAGMAAVVTSAMESAVGRLGALHVAAALGGPSAAGLATGSWFRADLAPFPEVVRGRLAVPKAPGLGLAGAVSGEWLPVAAPPEGVGGPGAPNSGRGG